MVPVKAIREPCTIKWPMLVVGNTSPCLGCYFLVHSCMIVFGKDHVECVERHCWFCDVNINFRILVCRLGFTNLFRRIVEKIKIFFKRIILPHSGHSDGCPPECINDTAKLGVTLLLLRHVGQGGEDQDADAHKHQDQHQLFVGSLL